jgi:hypothetical protein
MMRRLNVILAIVALAGCFLASERGSSNYKVTESPQAAAGKAVGTALRANSLCAKTEHIIFSCRLQRAGRRAGRSSGKIVSLCASPDLDKEHGYLQYRFGLPGKVELEYPGSQEKTQPLFQYSHYLRYQVDLTEINFAIDGYQYQIFDTYNGEEKPAISEEGVTVKSSDDTKEVSYVCRGKAQADFSTLQETLLRE